MRQGLCGSCAFRYIGNSRLSLTIPVMASAAECEVILRESIDGTFHVVDVTSHAPVAGPLPLTAALAYAKQRGAVHIFRQAVDLRGRLMGDLCVLEI
jgi:hypothetical protein